MKLQLFICIVFFAGVLRAQEPNLAFHADSLHSGNFSSVDFGPMQNLAWKMKTAGKIFGSPIVYKNLVFIGSGDKKLYALDATSGKLLWYFTTGGAVHSTPAISRSRVIFTSEDGTLYAIDALNGKLIWKFYTYGENKAGAKGLWKMKPEKLYMEDPFDFYLSSPVVSEQEQTVYFGSGDGYIYAVNASDGKLVWRFRTMGIVHTSAALFDGTVYIGSWDGNFYALNANDGKLLWKFKTGEDSVQHLLEGIQSSATVHEGLVYFGARDGYYYALDARSGELKWKYSANNSWVLTTGAVKDNMIFIGTSDSYKIICLDSKTGREIFSVTANGYVYSSPAISGNSIYVGDFTGQLIAIDIKNKKKMQIIFKTPASKLNSAKVLHNKKIDFQYLVPGMDLSLYSTTQAAMKKLYTLGPIVSSPFISNGKIYFGSADGYVYALNSRQK
jgi:eukaryotic-like serine/threonine-protein kinase